MNRKYLFKQIMMTTVITFLLYAFTAVFVILPNNALADTASDFQADENYIQSSNLPGNLPASVNAQSTQIQINPNPKQTTYYQNPNVIAQNATAKVNQVGSNGNDIKQGILVSPKYKVNMSSTEIQEGVKIQNNATAIADGTYKDCKKVGKYGIACGKKFYCMDGSCQQTSHDQNKDFGKSATQLAAASSAGNDAKSQSTNPHITPNNVRMFAGQRSECRIYPFGILNCCKDTGWGKGLFNCRASEKQLGLAKEKGVVVATGEYCAHHTFFGFCKDHHKTYCIFQSKLAFDVQLHGRKEQLGKDFGNAKSTHCDGISPSDMQRINFSKIDFSNVEQDIENQKTLPDFSAIQKQIAAAIAQNAGSPNPNPYSKGGV